MIFIIYLAIGLYFMIGIEVVAFIRSQFDPKLKRLRKEMKYVGTKGIEFYFLFAFLLVIWWVFWLPITIWLMIKNH